MWILACAANDDAPGLDPGIDAGGWLDSDATADSGPNDDDAMPDSGRPDSAAEDSGRRADAGPQPPNLPPGVVIDLAGSAGAQSVTLTWTSPAGVTKAYELRRSATPITTAAEFDAAEAVTPSPPINVLVPGTQQTWTISDLTPETTYHFALRVNDGAGKPGPISNDVEVKTLARAALLISEVAPANTSVEGGDFVELVATKAGSVDGLAVYMNLKDPPIYTFDSVDVAVGDRIVIHASGSSFPAGFAQEDKAKNQQSSTSAYASPDAFDVYSKTGDLSPNGAISIRQGETYIDAVPYSTRVDVKVGAGFDALFDAYFAWAYGAWVFEGDVNALFEDGCGASLQIANATGREPSPECGGYAGFIVPGWSLQRNGIVDTNTAADFFGAPQTRGQANAPYCATETAKVAMTEVNPRAGLVELSVTEGGRLWGFSLRTNPRDPAGASGTELVSFPDVCAATGDVIVVHLGAVTPSETTAKNQHPKATYPSHYDDAWDFTTDKELTFASSVVVTLQNPANTFVDVAAFSDRANATVGAYVASLRYVQETSLWLPKDCGGQLCGGATTPTAREVAVDWSSIGATPAMSAQRTNPAFPAQANDWSVGTSSFGQ